MTTAGAESEWFIAGDGAIGTALAYRFHLQSIPVTLITRRQQPDFVDLLYESVGEPPVKWSCRTRSELNGNKIRRLIIATKAYSVDEVIQTWGPSLEEGATVYFLQNGAGFYAGGLHESCEPIIVVNGGFTAYLKERHHVVQSAMKPLWCGSERGDPTPPSPEIEKELQILDRAGFHARWTTEIVKQRWEKISINTIVNAQAVIFNSPNGELLTHAEASVNTRKMCDEIGLLFEALSVDISADSLYSDTVTLLEATSRNICSTLQDYRKGVERHELGYINNALIKEARSHGIPMPVCEATYEQAIKLFSQNKKR